MADFTDYPWQVSYQTSSLKDDGSVVDILHDFYIPTLQRAEKYDRVAGYFRSTSLAAASEGYTAFLDNQGKCGLSLVRIWHWLMLRQFWLEIRHDSIMRCSVNWKIVRLGRKMLKRV